MNRTIRTHATGIAAVILAAVLVMVAAPAMASVIGSATASESDMRFTPSLIKIEAAKSTSVKIASPADEAAAFTQTTRRPTRVQAPLPRPTTSPARPATVSNGGNVRTAAAPAVAPARASAQPAPARPAAAAPAVDRLAQARAILARYAATYRHVAGTTVEFGDSRGNPQAIVFYKSKRIIINPNHTVSLERIINHEVWHIIDWHEDRAINWGEALPPSNANDFRL